MRESARDQYPGLARPAPRVHDLGVSSVQLEADALARTTAALADHALRSAYVRRALLDMAPDQVADLFTVVMASAEARRRDYAGLLQAISLALADESCTQLRITVHAVLTARQQPALARALAVEELEEDAETQRVPDFGRGRPVSLGERKSLARRNDRELLARVLRDPHPDVIRILLGNPALTEPDVVRLCARRPVSREVLREIFRSPRWIVRYPVKTALALNPYTPVDIALQLVPLLQKGDLRRVCRAEDVETDVREACARRIGRTGSTVLH